MNNRPTPETDAAASPHIGFYSCATVTANFARRLEIERDEAREHLEHVKEYGTEEINASVDLRQKLAQALVERDDAREAAHSFRSLYYAKTGINKGGCAFPWETK